MGSSTDTNSVKILININGSKYGNLKNNNACTLELSNIFD